MDAMFILTDKQKMWKSISIFDSEMMLLFVRLHPVHEHFFS
jgi:hypothetical protein